MDYWNGLKIAEEFYNEYGKAMLEEKFPEYKDKIAVGLAGQGSECFCYDDVVSRDHDFAPGFCLWVPEFIEKKIGYPITMISNGPGREDIIYRESALK